MLCVLSPNAFVDMFLHKTPVESHRQSRAIEWAKWCSMSWPCVLKRESRNSHPHRLTPRMGMHNRHGNRKDKLGKAERQQHARMKERVEKEAEETERERVREGRREAEEKRDKEVESMRGQGVHIFMTVEELDAEQEKRLAHHCSSLGTCIVCIGGTPFHQKLFRHLGVCRTRHMGPAENLLPLLELDSQGCLPTHLPGWASTGYKRLSGHPGPGLGRCSPAITDRGILVSAATPLLSGATFLLSTNHDSS